MPLLAVLLSHTAGGCRAVCLDYMVMASLSLPE